VLGGSPPGRHWDHSCRRFALALGEAFGGGLGLGLVRWGLGLSGTRRKRWEGRRFGEPDELELAEAHRLTLGRGLGLPIRRHIPVAGQIKYYRYQYRL
jgi:hypothetical protein